MARLRLDGPCVSWQAAAHRGRLAVGSERTRPVLVLLGPEGGPEASAISAAAPMLGRRADGLLTLLDLVDHEGRVAWVYEDVPGIGLGHFLDGGAGGRLPLAIAAAIVARVAETLHALAPSCPPHPGPAPDDVLLMPDGSVRLAAFVGPFPHPPAYREPQGTDGPEAVVYRLGILLAALTGGAVPPGASDASAHEAMVRRILIRVMARPRENLPARLRDWLTGMVAWEPLERPALSRVAAGLREPLGPGPDLPTWAAERVGVVRSSLAALDDRWQVDTYEAWSTTPAPVDRQVPRPVLDDAQRTLPGDMRLPVYVPDDPTLESPSADRRRSVPPEPGVIPVMVGPPPEAARSAPQLPRGFLDTGPSRATRRLPIPRSLLAMILVLVGLGTAFAVYLF